MTIQLSGSGGIISPTLDLTTPLAVADGGTGSGTINPYQMVLGTAQATTSGTSIDFTGIPSWVKRITVMLTGVSTNGVSQPLLRLGSAGGIDSTSTYSGIASFIATSSVGSVNLTDSFLMYNSVQAGANRNGHIILNNMGSNIWTCALTIGDFGYLQCQTCGSKTLSGTLDRLRLTTVNGTDTFDAGSINVMYEGYA